MPRGSLGTVTARSPPGSTEAGLVPWAESGMRIVARGRPRAVVVGPHDEQAGELAGGSGRRLEGGPGHAGQPAQDALGLEEHARAPPGRSDAGVAGWRSRKPGVFGRPVAHLGVVLHGAGPQRIGPEVHGEVAVGQAGEVGDEVAFGHLGQSRRRRRPPRAGPRRRSGTSSAGKRPGPAPRSGQLPPAWARRPRRPAGTRRPGPRGSAMGQHLPQGAGRSRRARPGCASR